MASSKPWIARQNIQMFQEKIAAETDQEKRRVLMQLLAAEQAKLSDLVAKDDAE